MRIIDVIAAVLLVVGGLNWGLVGVFQFDLVAFLFGGVEGMIARLIYTFVGLAAVYQAVSINAIQTRWHVRPRMQPV